MRRLAAMSRRERRVLLTGLIVALVAILVTRVLPAWRDWIGAEEARAERAVNDLARLEAALDRAAGVRDTLLARNARYLALAPALLAGDTPGAAGASLASIVSTAATGSGLRMGALQVRADTVRASVFSRVSVRGDAQGDVTGVTRFFATLEQGPGLLVVRQALLTQPDPAAPQERPEALRLEFVIDGLAITRAGVESRRQLPARNPGSTKLPSTRGTP